MRPIKEVENCKNNHLAINIQLHWSYSVKLLFISNTYSVSNSLYVKRPIEEMRIEFELEDFSFETCLEKVQFRYYLIEEKKGFQLHFILIVNHR